MTGQVWTAGPFRGWPSSSGEEKQLITQAAHHARIQGTPEPLERCDVTTLMATLRDGATLTELTAFLPGLQPHRLCLAHSHLEVRRAQAVNAWNAITAAPGAVSLTTHADHASWLLPVPVAAILRVAASAHSEHAIEHTIEQVAARVHRDTTYTLEVEADLHDNRHSQERRLRIGAELYQPHHDCLWASPYYLPRRITDLSPLRVMDLLGERVDP